MCLVCNQKIYTVPFPYKNPTPRGEESLVDELFYLTVYQLFTLIGLTGDMM